jgi:hypothetical protein
MPPLSARRIVLPQGLRYRLLPEHGYGVLAGASFNASSSPSPDVHSAKASSRPRCLWLEQRAAVSDQEMDHS